MKLLLATTNKGKLKELQALLSDLSIEVLSLHDFPTYQQVEETETTFAGNALLKARAAYKQFSIPVVADDSGLCVEALNNAPGVLSARYAGENADDESNNVKLLSLLEDCNAPIHAKFVCTAVYVDSNKELIAEGEVEGVITKAPMGENGFGYDPLFIPNGFSQTMAQLESDVKNTISHRAKAFNKLKQLLKDSL